MDPVSIAAVGWGISTAGWLISPLIAKLLNNCVSYLGFRSAYRLQELDSRIRQLKLMLEVAEASPQRGNLVPWVQKLKSAFYEAEDILDTIDYHSLKGRVLYQSANKTKQDVGTMVDTNVPPKLRSKLKETLDMIEKLTEEGQRLLSWVKLPANSDNINNTPTVHKTSQIPPPVLFGRDTDIQKIRGLLCEPGSSKAKCYSVVGIHGLPGSGKTTLAQSVCKEERQGLYFELIMWIHVSQNFTVEAVTAEMLEAASGERCEVRNLSTLQDKLEKNLGGKRFLLVLDDVWNNTDIIVLDTLLSPLTAGHSGSKILVTTRFKDVATALGAQDPYFTAKTEKDKSQSMGGLTNRDLPDIGRLTMVRSLRTFEVRKARGYEIQQLEHLNNLRGTLTVRGLQNIVSKEDACQANRSNKVHPSGVELEWSTDGERSNYEENQVVPKSKRHRRTRCLGDGQSADGQEEVLEALRPPSRISALTITGYSGTSYPGWLSGEKGKLEYLQHLDFRGCSGSAPPSEMCMSFVNLRKLQISCCTWNSLFPENAVENLTSLEELTIYLCENMVLLPRLPTSLKKLCLFQWMGSDARPGISASLVNLCTLQLFYCSLTSLPEDMARLTSLEELRIEDCRNILFLPRLPMSLKRLRLSHWRGSDARPGISASLVNLCSLTLEWCSLTSLPEDMERLTSLEELKIKYCQNILFLPRLPLSIKKFELVGWSEPIGNPGIWPENMEHLTSLEELMIQECTVQTLHGSEEA